MAKSILFSGVSIAFPSACVVCQQPASSDYKIEKVVSYGNRTITVTLPVPMCATHYDLASRKNAAEKRVGLVGVILGAVFGLATAIGLISYWASSGQGSGILNILLALFLGVGIFLIFWSLFTFFIAPNFADQDTKAARNAVKIRRYYPSSNEIQLDFYNDQTAEQVAYVNQERILKAR